MRKTSLIAAISLGISLLVTSHAFAATAPTPTCKPIYGGGAYNCNGTKLTVDKTVQNSQSGSFVQNLGVNDAHYSPDSTVTFRVIITNTGSDTIKNITIKDTFPQYLTYTAGEGKYDANTRALNITLASLDGGKTKQYDIKGKVASVQELPQDQSVICATNQIAVKAADQVVADSAQFCMQRTSTVTPGTITTPTPALTKGGQIIYPVNTNQAVTKTPPTGPEAIALFALAPAGLLGSFLRRKASK